MKDSRPIRIAAAGLASSALIVVTQILAAGVAIDAALYVALTVFAATIPFQIFISFMPVIERPLMKTHPTIYCIYWSVYFSATALSFIGFVAVFWHFACWLGTLFLATGLTAFALYRYCALKYFSRNSPSRQTD